MINKRDKIEDHASKFINILSQYSDDTLIDKSVKLINIIKLSGIDSITKDNQTLDAYKNSRNNLLKNFSSDFAMYFWEMQRKTVEYPNGEFSNNYAREVNERYKQHVQQSAMFHKEHYLAVITKHPEGVVNKVF